MHNFSIILPLGARYYSYFKNEPISIRKLDQTTYRSWNTPRRVIKSKRGRASVLNIGVKRLYFYLPSQNAVGINGPIRFPPTTRRVLLQSRRAVPEGLHLQETVNHVPIIVTSTDD